MITLALQLSPLRIKASTIDLFSSSDTLLENSESGAISEPRYHMWFCNFFRAACETTLWAYAFHLLKKHPSHSLEHHLPLDMHIMLVCKYEQQECKIRIGFWLHYSSQFELIISEHEYTGGIYNLCNPPCHIIHVAVRSDITFQVDDLLVWNYQKTVQWSPCHGCKSRGLPGL